MFLSPDKILAAVREKSQVRRVPAPVRGLIRNENPVVQKSGGAEVLENWFPALNGIVTRRGTSKYARLTGTTPVGAILPYIAGGNSKLFAANNAGIYDITTVADPTVEISAASGIGTVTSGEYSRVQFSTTGGDFLICVNGTNVHKIYDGSAWASDTPAITGTTSDNFSHVWSHQKRLFFIKKNSLTACYLPVDSIGGVASSLPLGGLFKLGGTLMFGSTWSVDSGEGMDDMCVFVTTEGEVAVFSGGNPASSTDWALQGLFTIGRPMGKNAFFKAGGDLAVVTTDGLIPLSQIYKKDKVALQQVAVSFPIESLWREYVEDRGAVRWVAETFPYKGAAYIGVPTYDGAGYRILVVNMKTGAWTEYTNYDVRSMASFQNRLFFGQSASYVYEAETTGADNGSAFVCRCAASFSDLKAPAMQKVMKMCRGIFKSTVANIRPRFSASSDEVVRWPSAPASALDGAATLWGAVTWGAFLWGGSTATYRRAEWDSIEGVGHSISWQVQVTLGNTIAPDIELQAVDLMFEVGDALA